MAEVGYLIGAGASAGCLPVVNKMSEDVDKLRISFLKEFGQSGGRVELSGGTYRNNNDLVNECLSILKNIQKVCSEHSSIDTYAKKLFVSGKDLEYRHLKNDMAFYFTLIQILRLPDKRYDNFWASILTEKDPPNKIKILSWNYDFQFEKSYMDFSGNKNLNEVSKKLKICSPWCLMDRGNEDKFNLTKLNGSAKFRNRSSDVSAYYTNLEHGTKRDNIISLFDAYYLSRDKEKSFRSELEFAWESSPRDHLIKNITPILNKIEVLVIIGYSFPFFNRKIDEKLFNGMSALQKIIIQDLYPESIEERLVEIIGDEITIELKRDATQFVFPKELEV